MTIGTKVGAVVVAVAAAFLIGFIPEFLQTRRLQTELDTARENVSRLQVQAQVDEARRLAGRMLLQVYRQNYGTAGELSTKYFDTLRVIADRTDNPSLKSSAAELLQLRDPITMALAQANAAVVPELQALLQRNYDLPDPARQ
jgi:hypothetical protein